MSAIGLSNGPTLRIPKRIISAHAEYRRSDFVFPRTQSLDFRATPWDRRLKPMRSWSELGAYGAGGIVAIAALLATLL